MASSTLTGVTARERGRPSTRTIARAAAVLCVASKAFDQADRLTIIGRHRASTDGFTDVNEIR